MKKVEDEKRSLQKEIEQLIANISSSSDDITHKLKETYLHKLNGIESQVLELKKKQDAQAQLLRLIQSSDEAAKKHQDEIHRIKTQKVQLQQKIKLESEQFRLWKASQEKQVLQLRKEGRRNEYEMHKLLALNQKQKMVLQRKTEEASMATKRLKELLESRKASSRDTFDPSAGSSSDPGFQALMQAIEHTLEVTLRVHEVLCEHERQEEETVKMAKEVAELKAEANIAKHSTLSNDVDQHISSKDQITLQDTMDGVVYSTLDERCGDDDAPGLDLDEEPLAEKAATPELATGASDSGDNPQASDHSELSRMEKIKKLYLSKSFKKKSTNQDSSVMDDGEGHMYNLRPKGLRNSIGYNIENLEISESENSDFDETDDEWSHGITCCSCSNNSSCKTMKCECRAINGFCSMSCNCLPRKCSNRIEELVQPPVAEDGNVILSDGEDLDKASSELASHGAMLLQSALSEIKDADNDKRKPLSDIGNKTAKPNLPKPPAARKKWRKSTKRKRPSTLLVDDNADEDRMNEAEGYLMNVQDTSDSYDD